MLLTLDDLREYQKILVSYSGGKDSTALVLLLLKLGVPRENIELWHQEVDGREGSTLMDWPVTPAYCKAVAKHLGIPIYFQWKMGGIEREMLRHDTPTAPTCFETPSGELITVGGKGPKGTREMFPQVTSNLALRWCSAYDKIDPCTAAIINQKRFRGVKTLVLTGERAEESASRAKYKIFEPDRADRRDGKRVKRHVDRWRPVHGWKEGKVWEIMEEYGVVPHPAYQLGYGRLSCMMCIFSSASQWASSNILDPAGVERIIDYEKQFGKTIHRTLSVTEQIAKGAAYPNMDPKIIKQALSQQYTGSITTKNWKLPAGAFGENAGPT